MSQKEFDKVGAYDFTDESKQKGYAESIRCNNCNWSDNIYIPFGKQIKEYLSDKSCERCKCQGTLY